MDKWHINEEGQQPSQCELGPSLTKTYADIYIPFIYIQPWMQNSLFFFFFFYFVIVVYNYKYLELKYMNAFYRKLLETTFLLVLEYLLKYGLVPFHLNRQNS